MLAPLSRIALALLALILAAPVSAQTMPPGAYPILSERSVVRVSVRGIGGKAQVDFPFTGKVVVGPDGSIIEARTVMDVRQMRAGNQLIKDRLAGRAGFDIQNHPEAVFQSSRILTNGDRLTAEGRLTMKGTTQPVTFTGRITQRERHQVSASLEGAIDRTAFGITAGRLLFGKNATVTLRLIARIPRQ